MKDIEKKQLKKYVNQINFYIRQIRLVNQKIKRYVKHEREEN